MIDNDKLIEVRNRDSGTVGYTIEDLGNIHRSFRPKETKKIPMEELRKLFFNTPGGSYLIKNCLVVGDKEALAELLPNVQPEYFFDEKRIKKLLQKDSLERLLDALDFAPTGVIELIKKYAVELEINDIAKRTAILEKTGFNVTKAIEVNHETSEENEEKPKETGRRVKTQEDKETEIKRRRAELPKYDIVEDTPSEAE